MNSNPTFLVISYFFLVLGYIFSIGLYEFSSFWIVTSVFVLLLSSLFIKLPKTLNHDARAFTNLLSILIVISIAITLYWPKEFYELNTVLKPLQFYIFLTAFITSLTLFIDLKYQYKKFRFIILLALPVISQVLVVVNTPHPKIDVFDILQGASYGILKGANPYTMTFNQIYLNITPDYFTYMPLSFLINIPSRIIFGDVRFTSIASLLVTCLVIYFVGKRQKIKEETSMLIILLFIYHPLLTLIVGEGWLDPILVALFALFGYLYLSHTNKFWSYFMLALALGIKQNMFLVLPFLVKLKSFNLQKLVLAYVPIILIILLFFTLSPQDFISDVVKEPFFRNTRFDALTFYSFLYNLNPSIQIPKIIFLLPLLLIPLILSRKWISIGDFYLAFAIWFLSSLIFFREAFLNQYYFVSSLLLLSAVFQVEKENNKK